MRMTPRTRHVRRIIHTQNNDTKNKHTNKHTMKLITTQRLISYNTKNQNTHTHETKTTQRTNYIKTKQREKKTTTQH